MIRTTISEDRSSSDNEENQLEEQNNATASEQEEIPGLVVENMILILMETSQTNREGVMRFYSRANNTHWSKTAPLNRDTEEDGL